MKWEYRIARMTTNPYELQPMALDEKGKLVELKDRTAPELINQLGSDGWELVAVTHTGISVKPLYLLWFKRAVI